MLRRTSLERLFNVTVNETIRQALSNLVRLLCGVGGTGHWPVPAGDPPDGMDETSNRFRSDIGRFRAHPGYAPDCQLAFGGVLRRNSGTQELKENFREFLSSFSNLGAVLGCTRRFRTSPFQLDPNKSNLLTRANHRHFMKRFLSFCLGIHLVVLTASPASVPDFAKARDEVVQI